jgi:Na+/phosphate symporter
MIVYIVTLLLALVVCLAGLFMYLFLTSPKADEIGKIMFSCGLLAFLLILGLHQ